jgi:hypothetical protein
MVGVGVSGYGCAGAGHGTAALSGPTALHAVTSPASSGRAAAAGIHAGNATSVPADAHAAACPLVGVDVTGYGCGTNGSGAAAIFAPAAGNGSTTPSDSARTSAAGLAGSAAAQGPTGVTASACPLVGIGVSGYSCENPGSGTAVVFAPGAGSGGSNPAGQTHLTGAGTPAGGALGTPISTTVATCPLIGVNATGYGCGPAGANGGQPQAGPGNPILGGSPSIGIGTPTSGGASPGGLPHGPTLTTSTAGLSMIVGRYVHGSGARNAAPVAKSVADLAIPGGVASGSNRSTASTSTSGPSGSRAPAPVAVSVPIAPVSGRSNRRAGQRPAGVETPSRSSVPSLTARIPRSTGSVAGMTGTGARGNSGLGGAPAGGIGISTMPRTGGGNGSPTMPTLPLQLALILFALGYLLRMATRMTR